MKSTKKTARIAGLLYLLASIPGAFCLIYIPSHFIVSGDASATATKIAASEFVFRLGILSELAGFIGFIFVVRALYRLFAGVSKAHASLMVTLILVSIPISLLNVVNETAALTLIRGANFLSGIRQGPARRFGVPIPSSAFRRNHRCPGILGPLAHSFRNPCI